MLQGFYTKLNFIFSLWLSLLYTPIEILVWNLTFKSQANLGQSLDPSWQCLFLSNLLCYKVLYQVKVLDFHCGCHCYSFQLKLWCGILLAFFYLICYVTRFLYQVKVLDFHYGCHCYFFQLKFWCGILRLSLMPTWVSPLTQVDSAFFCTICYVTRFLYQVKVLDFHCGCHWYLFQLKFWCGILRLSFRPNWVSPWPKLTVPFFLSNL